MGRDRRSGSRWCQALAGLALLSLAAGTPLAAQVGPRESISVVGPAAVFPLAVAAGERFAVKTEQEMPVAEPVGTEAGLALFCAGRPPASRRRRRRAAPRASGTRSLRAQRRWRQRVAHRLPGRGPT
jgi:hypothetical protein